MKSQKFSKKQLELRNALEKIAISFNGFGEECEDVNEDNSHSVARNNYLPKQKAFRIVMKAIK